MARFDLDSYETVAERLVRFWADNPDGRIETRLINYLDGKMDQFIVHTSIYRHKDDEHPVATGLAEEQFQDRGPNQTSPIENCETSSIGRALSNWIYCSDSDKRPSREEMEKVERGSTDPSKHIAEAKAAVKTASGNGVASKVDVQSDSRWPTIKAGVEADPSNEFLRDLVSKGEKWGTLSEKQLSAGFNAATKAMKGQPVHPTATAAVKEAFPGSFEERPF